MIIIVIVIDIVYIYIIHLKHEIDITHTLSFICTGYVNCLIKCKIINTSTNFLLIENLYLKPVLYI